MACLASSRSVSRFMVSTLLSMMLWLPRTTMVPMEQPESSSRASNRAG